jgi:threonine dehydrogenase-like Zn-dependent dehydrogenase
MGAPVDEPCAVAFECSGRADAIESAIDQLDFAGVCVLVGTGHDLPRINHNRVIVLESTIIGSYNYDAAGFAPALELLASGTMPLGALVEPDDVTLDDLLPVMRRCAAGELPGKVMVRPIRSEEGEQS